MMGFTRRIGLSVALSVAALACVAAPVLAMTPPRATPSGWQEVFGLPKVAKGEPAPVEQYIVNPISCSAPANVLWPGDPLSLTLQFVNKTDQPIEATGKLEVIAYGTKTTDDIFATEMYKIADAGSVPLKVKIDAKGYVNVAVQPAIPESCGGYALVADLGPLGRSFVTAIVRTLPAKPGKVQYPAYALDAKFVVGADNMCMFPRLGIKAIRMEWGYTPTTGPGFYDNFAKLADYMAILNRNEVAVMLTMGGGGPQPMNAQRPHLDANAVMMPGKYDAAWVPDLDPDFQKQCKAIATAFGWPRGPLNAMELWNEPWEGLSISGWGADCLRYREIYTAMSQGVEEARTEGRVQVLLGGCCSSMNTLDKLFPDGKDTFLKWLDFTSIHYQPMAAVPALIPEWQNRKDARGKPDPVRVWDTESWMANTEDRVLPVLASMRAQGQTRTAGVLHDAVYDGSTIEVMGPLGSRRQQAITVWSPGVAVAAFQSLVGERPFREILFKSGLPWIFVFDGLTPVNTTKDANAIADDAVMVVVGDLGGLFGRERLLFRTVHGLNETAPAAVEQVAKLEKDLAATTRPADKKPIENKIKNLQLLSGGSLTVADPNGEFRLVDHMGNSIAPANGKLVVPLDTLGFYLCTNGSKGSVARLVAAVRAAEIKGYEPVEILARDMLDRVENQPALRLKITNIYNRPVSGKLSVTLEGLTLDGAQQDLQLQPYEVKEVALKITGGKAAPSNSYALKTTFDAGKDGHVAHDETMHCNVIAHKTIKIDGDLSDWEGVLPQPIASSGRSKQDITEAAWFPFKQYDEKTSDGFANGYLAYDDQFFYFAAKIADSTPYPGSIRFETRDDSQYFYPDKCYRPTIDPNTKAIVKLEELTWPEGVRHYTYRTWPETPTSDHMDNVQIGFNVIPDANKAWYTYPKGTMPHFMAYLCTDYEYVLNQVAEKSGGGTEIWRLYAPGLPRKHFNPHQPKADKDGGPVKEGKLAMNRVGNTRIVELALPWSEIPAVKACLDAGGTVKFAYRVNDNSGPSYELAENRSVSQYNSYAFHNDWAASWNNEIEFSFEGAKTAAKEGK